MQLVLDLAGSTHTQTLPNPQVAAIIVKNEQVIGIGAHLKVGGHHAEIYALNQAGSHANGATLYVNLEPCAHHGRTPPCVNAIINAKIKRVVIANLDENPVVHGCGVEKLTSAGIAVTVGILAEKAYKLNKIFFHNIKYQEPYITLKVGMSLDGKIATKDNLSQWITSSESRKDGHQYRVEHTAVLVGVDTVLKDNPHLTAHLLPDGVRNPVRVVLDSSLQTPLTARMILDQKSPVWICTTSREAAKINAYKALGVKVICLPNLEIATVLHKLYENNIYSVLVEGGEKVYASFIESGRFNQLVAYISPQLIGSSQAKHFFAGNGFANLQDNIKLQLIEVMPIGDDIKLIYSSSLKPLLCHKGLG